jgi:hypothetical protein
VPVTPTAANTQTPHAAVRTADMGEWQKTNDGRPLKTTDALLDWGYGLMQQIDALEEELRLAMDVALSR